MRTCMCCSSKIWCISKNLEEWVPQTIDEIILIGDSIANTNPTDDSSSFKIRVDLGSVLHFANGDMGVHTILLSKERCINQKALKYKISYTFEFSEQILLLPLQTQETVLLSLVNGCYFCLNLRHLHEI